MDKGIQQLECWLYDVIRIGLLQYDFSNESIFEISSRMVDAKLGGIARRLRSLPTLNRADEHWIEEVLSILGELYLMVSAFKRKDEISTNLLISLYSIAGYNIKKSDLLSLTPVHDTWKICGIEYEEDENLRSRFTWVMGAGSKRTALLLDFAFGRTDFETKYDFNKSYHGPLFYYPGSFPLRAYLQNPGLVKRIRPYPGAFEDLDKFLDVYAGAISKNPWINNFPASLKNIILLKSGNDFLVQDQIGQTLHVDNESSEIWPLFSALGLACFNLFGIWNGKSLRILSWDDGNAHMLI